MDTKPFWTSKTLIFNVIAGAVVVAGYFGYADFIPDEKAMALIMAIVNMVLRFVTTQPVSLLGGK